MFTAATDDSLPGLLIGVEAALDADAFLDAVETFCMATRDVFLHAVRRSASASEVANLQAQLLAGAELVDTRRADFSFEPVTSKKLSLIVLNIRNRARDLDVLLARSGAVLQHAGGA